MRIGTRARQAKASLPLALVASGVVLLPLAGCAQFDGSSAGQTFQPAPKLTAEAGPQPELPEAATPAAPTAPQESPKKVPPPNGCKDFDPAVIATCLDTVSAVAALPTDGSSITALAGERKSGRVFLVGTGVAKTEFARLPVNAGGGGGLTALELSPTYSEDRLVFAYVTTPNDNRVVRFAEGQPPKPVLTGIPRGPSGNRGALLADAEGNLLVATGDAGNPSQASRKTSLAGKILRITTSGKPAEGNPDPRSPVFSSGLHEPGGLCMAGDGSRAWVTDQDPNRDAVYRIEPGRELTGPAWTWPDKPGVTGCADWNDVLAVATAGEGNVQHLPLTADGAVGGKPQVTLDGDNGTGYGRLGSLDQLTPDVAVAGTVNKDGGDPVSSDDRVVLVVRQPAAGSGRD